MNKKMIEQIVVIIVIAIVISSVIHIGESVKTAVQNFQNNTNTQYEELLPEEPIPASPAKLNP
jgi:hypothetical protein